MTIEVVELYNTLSESTTVAFDKGPKEITESISRNSYIANLFMAGKGMRELVDQGPKIKDRILLNSRDVLQATRPGSERDFSNPQSGADIQTHWAYYVADLRWDEVEIAHNTNVQGLTKSAMKTYVKDVMYQKEQSLFINMMENFDDLFFRTPDVKLMEHLNQAAQNAKPVMIPINFFVNEETNGLYSGFGNTNGDNTTILGQSPATNANWNCERITYSAASANVGDMSNDNNVVQRLELMGRRLKFKPPSMWKQYYNKETPLAKHAIITGELGATQLRKAFRQNGELFTPDARNDGAFAAALSAGVPVIEYRELDEKNLYSDGASAPDLTTAANAGAAGARYYCLNLDHMWPKFYANKMFTKGKVKEIANTDGAYRQAVFLWCQLWTNSLRSHGILYPSGS